MKVLELINVSKVYGKRKVLDGVSFYVNRNEIFGFIGHNGAGKSTTMKIIMGFIKPSSGKVLLFEKENTNSEVKKKIGFLPEYPYFYENVTGVEFLKFLQYITGMDRTRFWKNVETFSEKLEISWALDKKLSEYSKGMLQRLGILQTVVCEPELLILDEPMSGLDPIGRRLVIDLMLELKGKGKTIFFSTHILPDIERVCDRAIIIVNGKITDEVDKSSLSCVEEILMKRVKEEGVKEVR